MNPSQNVRSIDLIESNPNYYLLPVSIEAFVITFQTDIFDLRALQFTKRGFCELSVGTTSYPSSALNVLMK